MDYIIALIPSLFAGLVLYFILRSISRMDRTERETQKKIQDDAAQWYEMVKNSKGSKKPFEVNPEKSKLEK